MVTSERRHAVLRAIVEGYVATSEPVGSVALAASNDLGVSSATIRNDMAALEDEGLIAQPHTSAGRIPTDAGYRSFVDHLAESAMRESEKRAITSFLSDPADVGDVVEKSVKLLAQITKQVAVIQYPTSRTAPVRHVEVVRSGPERALVVVVSSDARVEQSVVALNRAVDDTSFEAVAKSVGAVSEGLSDQALEAALSTWLMALGTEGAWAAPIVDAVARLAQGGVTERVIFAGASHLARAGGDFEQDSVAHVLDALEEQVVLLRLLHEITADAQDVSVRIGHENPEGALSRTSIVATGYGAPGDSSALVGALGPTRMDYQGTISSVRAVARYLSKAVAE